MLGVADSLNVSVTAAILLYEARRQRGTPGLTARAHAMRVRAMPAPWSSVRLRDHRRRPGRRGRRVQGARARRHRRHHRSPVVRRQLPAHRLHARRSRCSTAPPTSTPTRRLRLVAGLRRGATTWSTGPPDAAEPDDSSHVTALEAAGAVVYRGRRPDHRPRPRQRRPTTATTHELDGDERRRRRRLDLEGPADRGHRRRPALDEPRGDARAGAAGEPARPRRRPDRLRARPGLRPVRRPDDDRPVRPAARARPTIRATPRRSAGRSSATACACGPASARCGHAPAPGPTAPTSSTSTTARPPRATRSCSRSAATSRSTTSVSSTTASTRRAGRLPARRAAAHRRRAVGHRRPGRPRAAHAPGPLPGRARRPDGPRRGRSSPDYRALPRATYTDPEAAFVGLTLDQATAAGLDAFEFVADFAKSAKGYAVEAKIGHVTIVVDRATRELVGAAMACPDASAAIHECVARDQGARARSTSWPRRSTPSRRRRGSSTACSRRRSATLDA